MFTILQINLNIITETLVKRTVCNLQPVAIMQQLM